MKTPRFKGICLSLSACWFPLVGMWVPSDPGWVAAYVATGCLGIGWMMWAYVTDDPIPPEVQAQRRLEISRQKTAELEKELGLEPLNLHELDDLVMEERSHPTKDN